MNRKTLLHIHMLLLLVLAACGGGGTGGSPQGYFLIAWSDPSSNGLGVPLEAVVTVRFNKQLADVSVVPTSLGVNPQLTIMAMATRIAWHMRENG